ncbi:PPE domain-containing protein [Mycolicibacterium peregrinum]|uniref:PPE domain-containing protein n=1 Tax=Mycolicibacterium peregrinum TaxID=43304 RepID=UPI0010426569|nr:PPE domain-containing protein [Mycolicibacterium peregrinum]
MIQVDDDGLARDGAGLCSSAQPGPSGVSCAPAAEDATSVAMAGLLNGWNATVSALLDHAAKHREIGGIAVAGSGRTIAAADEENAAAIRSVVGGASAPAPSASAPADVPMIAPPSLPALPFLPGAPPPMTGEQIAQYVHGGPGADSVRNLASSWRSSVAPAVSKTADETYRYAAEVDQHWEDDGRQQAGANVFEHAEWLSSPMHDHVIALADRADEYASHIDELRNATPTPEEFSELRNQVNNGMAIYRASNGLNAAPLVAATAKLAEKQGQAIDAYTTYTAAASTTAGSAPTPPPPAPAIVRGGPIQSMHSSKSPGAPKDPKDDKVASSAGTEDGPGAGGKDPLSDVAGKAVASDAAVPPGTPEGVAAAATPTTAPGMAANVAGTIVGAITGTASQLAGGLPGSGGGSMLPNALSGLSSALPAMTGGMPQSGSPSMPSDMGAGGGSPSDDLGLDDFGTGGTTPASSGGPGGGGGAPVSGAGPAVGYASPVSAAPAPPISAASTPGVATGSAGGPMGGMFPPMMGGLGGDGAAAERNKDNDRRVVLRPAANSEPVFGAVERKRSTRRASSAASEKGNNDNND